MNDTVMTIVGNVVDEPRLRLTKSGHSVTNFRIASTSRRYDGETGKWVDNSTLFVTITCWLVTPRELARSSTPETPENAGLRILLRQPITCWT